MRAAVGRPVTPCCRSTLQPPQQSREMKNDRTKKFLPILSLCAPVLLGGCGMTLLDPKGQIGADEKSIIITATWLMLIVVIPVIVMTLVFAWKYRASNKQAKFEPNWAHSTKIEVIVWLIPCLIIVALGIMTWTSSHRLDPYKPLASDVKPITIEAVSLNWKWLFIYPDLHIATVNQIAFPANTPINFKITSDSIMNSFFIPQLGSQVYAMAGMETKLHLIADETGTYDGISANYSGSGFSDMKFTAVAKSNDDFEEWVREVKESSKQLDHKGYGKLAQPSEKHPVEYFSSVDPQLYHDILHKYMGNNMDTSPPAMNMSAGKPVPVHTRMPMDMDMPSATKE